MRKDSLEARIIEELDEAEECYKAICFHDTPNLRQYTLGRIAAFKVARDLINQTKDAELYVWGDE